MQISVLPYAEAVKMKKDLFRVHKEEWNRVLEKGMLSEDYRNFLRPILPQSWKNNHKADDKIETLNSGAFDLVFDFIKELALYQIPYGEGNS
jgi:hypothetical protein